MTFTKRIQVSLMLVSVSLVGVSLCLPCTAQESLDDILDPVIDAHDGKVAVAIKHLENGDGYTHHADTPMPTASLIKLPLMVALFDAVQRGEVSLDEMITLTAADQVPGSGILTSHFSPGTKIPVRDALRLMIVFSDNTATNLIIDQVGLPATAKLMEQMGWPETKLHSKVYRRETSIFPERSKQYGLGSTTAADMVALLEMIEKGDAISNEASAAMLKLLYDCDDRSKIPRFLPTSVEVAHKTGSVSASRTDAGIIDGPSGKIAICVLTTDNDDRSWSDENEAEVLCGKIAKLAFDFFNPEGTADAGETGPKLLTIGASGKLVEALQRTLNDRLGAGKSIGVDGDFGPATQGAVIAFQKANDLPGSGDVDAATWKALGSLITEPEPVPPPEVVNAEVIEKSAADPLDGPPIVTCKAWAIGDGKTGELLWGFNEDGDRDPASTTKIMTGFLAASLATQDPSVLDEVVTFSSRADNTGGSTSGVEAGERLSVRELLYGLLLPSGNDASVAIAEHFGGRCSDSGQIEEGYDAFIATMNERAKQLGMGETTYKNTHGLTEVGHMTSARDLLRLAYAAMKLPLFREIVGTPQHGCTLRSTAGYERNVVWRNTNRLLKIEGFDGVKTGTTNAAGACLVSRGERDGQQLIVVVLGAASTDSRYTDSRNLYRWAWTRLPDEK